MKDKTLIIDTNIVYYWYEYCEKNINIYKFDIEKLVNELEEYAHDFCLAVNLVTVYEIINHYRRDPNEAIKILTFLDNRNVWSTSSRATDNSLTYLAWEDYIENVEKNVWVFVQEKMNFEVQRFYEYKMYLIQYVLEIIFENQSDANSDEVLKNINILDSVFNNEKSAEIIDVFLNAYNGENEATDIENLFKKMVKEEFDFIFNYIQYKGINDDDLDKYFLSIRNEVGKTLSRKIKQLASRDDNFNGRYQEIAGSAEVFVDVFVGYQKLSEGYNDYLKYRLGKIFFEEAKFNKNDIGDLCIFSELEEGNLILTNDLNMRKFLMKEDKYNQNSDYIEELLSLKFETVENCD
jgi:hypothetical protein